MQSQFTVSSKKRFEIIDITKKVEEILTHSKINQGLCNIFTNHATSAIIINEHEDEELAEDIMALLEKQIPRGIWKNDEGEGNTDAHLKASIIGPSKTIPISEGKLLLGRWQSILFADFDGPREKREIIVTILGDANVNM